ncbi:hypothetical protein EXIGLDRAFT_717242 [Exidia glandulosa HHB12029]|uniref:Secreted protein n=1 Tax=Exidia glandulosa HHB12029 TaxID=1314781 RepID=A0A165P4X6_EXIGL|nr:hypothetical protein EXIGLDRAFT_717242 [Exidia glandulosa HHB12029]
MVEVLWALARCLLCSPVLALEQPDTLLGLLSRLYSVCCEAEGAGHVGPHPGHVDRQDSDGAGGVGDSCKEDSCILLSIPCSVRGVHVEHSYIFAPSSCSSDAAIAK